MKKLLLILILFNGLVAISQGTWEKLSVPSTVNLNTLFFTDSINGWIAGDSGVMLHTVNGGASWIPQATNTLNQITDIFFLNSDEGWATSHNFIQNPLGTVILKTVNGGQTWLHVPYPDSNIFINCIFYFDEMNGWMGGSPHALVRTYDGGQTWQQAAIDTSTLAFFPVETIKFYNSQYGYASGGIFDVAGVIWRTNNGGALWYAIDPSEAPADEIHGLHLYDSIHVIGAGGDPDFGYGVGMMRTDNGGISWEYEELSMQGTALDIDFRNENEAWAPLGTRMKLIYSLDSGNSWTEIDTPDSTIIGKMDFPDALHGYAVGRNGAFLKYTPPVTGIAKENNKLNLKIFPNPASNLLYFESDISGKAYLMDLPGKIILQTVLENNKGVFDVSGLPEGMYLLRFTGSNGGQATKKIVVN